MELWDWSLTVSKDAEMKARIPGVKSMMTTFDFLFWLYPGRAASEADRRPRSHRRTLQDSSTPVAQGNRLTQDVVKTSD